MTLDPLYITALGRRYRVRHDDPTLKPYSPAVTRLRSAVELASDVEGLRLVRETTTGERYAVQVTESEIRLRRR